VHDHGSTWLARWIDKLTDKEKYVWLSDGSKIRQEQDKAKYDKAKILAANLDQVVRKIHQAMRKGAQKPRMVATAAYLIYKLAMRVGDEKDPDEADTVGASTLRVEHLKFGDRAVEFDFLGKDSVRWVKTLEVSGEDETALENLREFVKKKKPQDVVFSGITSRTVNEFFGTVLKGLTAKVFRTALATEVVTDALAASDRKAKEGSESAKVYHAKMANLQAAITCNHKRAIPKNFEEGLQKKREALEKLKAQEAKTEKQAERREARIEKAKLQLELALQTRDYNLGTSLRNYIDPRPVVSWCGYVGLDWKKLYTRALQKKFMWVEEAAPKWKKVLQERKD
jgi:DNA topoisomerase-1